MTLCCQYHTSCVVLRSLKLVDGNPMSVFQVSVGTVEGVIFTYDTVSYQLLNKLVFHAADVRSACIRCIATDRLVFSSAGLSDSRVAVWRWPGKQRATARK